MLYSALVVIPIACTNTEKPTGSTVILKESTDSIAKFDPLSEVINLKYEDFFNTEGIEPWKSYKMEKRLIIGTRIPIYAKPYKLIDTDEIQKVVEYGDNIDTVLVPTRNGTAFQFMDGGESGEGSFLVLTSKKNMGFVRTHNLIMDIYNGFERKIPNSDYLVLSPRFSNLKVVVNEKSRQNYLLEANDFIFSDDGAICVISRLTKQQYIPGSLIPNYKGEIYIHDVIKNKSVYLTDGFSPVLLNIDTMMFFKEVIVDSIFRGSIVLYDLKNKLICSEVFMADSLSFRISDGDVDIVLSKFDIKSRNFPLYSNRTGRDFNFKYKIQNKSFDFRLSK
jgi:hypothetical protein